LEGLFQIDIPRSGLDNMSIDQAMLEQTAVDLIPRMRIYQWIEPTISLGYFQKYADFENFESTKGLPVVRRATGGGAIVHHFDWTYSIAMPSAEAGAVAHGASARLYDCVHRAVVAWLEQCGIWAQLWSAELSSSASCITSGCSFLCFERRHAGDVVCEGPKIMGSAQRRFGGAILQHGSLLLRTSPFAPTLIGLAELPASREASLAAELTRFSEQLRDAVAFEFSFEFLGCEWVKKLLPIPYTIRDKFASSHWIARI
jgi:lipoyl(octanoyl) transferase